MAIVSVVVAITVVISTMVSEEIVKYISQWLIENMVKPVGQLLIEKLVKPIGQWLGYLFHYSSNIENMKEQWLENADLIMREAKQVIEDEEKSKMRCSYAICLNLKQRHQQSKKAKKIVQDINEVLKIWRSNKVFHMDYMNFGSRMVTVKELMVALGDANFNMIGVWGMPGVGKTTLVSEIAKQVKEKKLFDEVAIATVTQSPDPKKIQGEIADKLDLKLDKETPRGRADLLRVMLTEDNNKKILIILDDIWEKLDLDEIGIPRTGCKVVLTSRNKDVLSSEMGTQKDFGLEVLHKEEAWCLFEKLSGLSGDSLVDSNLRSKAIEVSTACAGLPLALVTVAKALKNKRLFEWEDALQKLRRPAPRNQKRMQEVIYSAIKLSYNHLESTELKSFFLFCAQHQYFSSNNYEDILKKCFGLRLFHGISTLEEARNRTYTLVRSLKDSGLLLDAPDSINRFRMHDLTRDAALLVAYETQNVLVMRDEGLVEWPDDDDMKMCTAIFVFNRNIHELPDRLECPELRYLDVYAKDREGSFKISDTFFEGMRKLKVLDLTYMRISSLPSSLKLLTNLRTLCLDDCVLGDIALIGEMKNLEILSLNSSEFKQLPREIGLLTHLRMLDLSNCKKLQMIPANVLSRLIVLEELYVGNSFTQWEVEGLNNERASLAELKHLSRLSTLEVHIPDANMMPKDLLFEKLKRYKIFIGDVWDWSDKHENSRGLKLKLNTCNQLESGIKMLFNGIEDLCLDKLNGVKSIVYELDMKGFQQLKHLHVQNNAEIKYIIHSGGLVIDDVVFPALKIFSLKNMINLEGICNAQLPLTSFRDIRILKMEHCEKLKFVFSSSIAKGLSQLQELEIKECNIMRAIVVKEDGELEDRDMISFPQLRHLKLRCLPKLVSFLSTQNSIIADVGEIIHEGELDFQEIPHTGMQPLFNEEVVFPNLETLELSSIHSEEILLHNQHRATSSFKLTDPRFHNLCKLIVKGSGNLKYLLSSSTARFMVQLKYLYIEDCKVMEEVLLTEDLGEEEIIPKVLFPRLEDLVLKDLPVLKRFCVVSNIKFPSLKDMVIEKCPKLESFIFKPVSSGMTLSKELKEVNSEEISQTAMQPLFNEEVAFPNLESLLISHMPNLEIIWHDKFAPGSYMKLQSMDVQFCESLMNIFQVNMLSRFQSLESLVVGDCGSLQEIFELEGQEVTETRAVTVTQLKKLFMHRLPKLKRVWNKDPQETFSFTNLQQISVWKCESLKSLFPTSMARCLKQLDDLRIAECGIEEIIEQEEGAKEDARFVFPKLTLLILRELSKLKWFYRGVHTSEWPLLKTFEVSGSNEIQTFASKNYRIQEQDEQSQLETSIQQPLFLVEEVAFPSLETLTIMHMENLKIIWYDQLAEDSFFKLQSLLVYYCENLVNIFESNMLTRFQSLERLQVSYCGSLQEVFELQRHDVSESHVVTAIPLKGLTLHRLPKMKQVWNKDPQGIFSFQNLQLISVWECESLNSLFPASMARCLMQLEDLRIVDCGVEEIVSREEIVEAEARFVFPKVTLLVLRKLPKLKWFCRGVHTSKWPLLRDLVMRGCDQIEIFTSKNLNFQETVEQSQLKISIQQPLFLVEEGTLFPNLEALTLGGNYKMKEIQRDQLFEECLYKLKVLHVIDYVAASDWIAFLKRLHSLEKLFVKSSSWEEIFPYKELFNMENHATILPKLRKLELSELPMLTHLWKEDTQPSLMFHNLENLKVLICDKLKNLVPSSVSFQNLTNLEICKCHGLINLVTSSTAKSLVQLKKMSVSECERITEVVAGEGGEASEVITFTQLTYLKLDCLPNLSSFCSISYSFEFPSLEEVIVRQCPEMKTFSHGALGTPKLERVQATQEDEWHWKANLNTTIHWLWKSKYNTTTQ
nr:uncharacterized protein LOC112015678 [Quercus suber]